MVVRPPTSVARSRSAVGLALTFGLALLLTPVVASAQAKPGAVSSEVAQLQNECARLRAELDRANADIASLKRADRGFRNDYRLRQRLADAEALARKLTEAEARLGARAAHAPATRAPLPATPPVAAPTDGPVELEAKADLLTDQSKRLAAEADTLSMRAGQLRDRQMLRRRSLQLEHDPFIGVETSKRNMVFGGTRTSTVADSSKSGSSSPGNESLDRGTQLGGGGTPAPMAPAPMAPAPGPAAPGAPVSGTPTPGTGSPPSTSTSSPTFGGAPPPAPPPQTPAVSSQVRTLLDPATLLQVQRLERSGKPFSDADALDKAAAALRQRAQALDAQAKSLRTRSGR